MKKIPMNEHFPKYFLVIFAGTAIKLEKAGQ